MDVVAANGPTEIACGYSVNELAREAGILSCTIQRLDLGKPVDKLFLPPLATALGVPYCELLCGDHSCAERACVQAPSLDAR